MYFIFKEKYAYFSIFYFWFERIEQLWRILCGRPLACIGPEVKRSKVKVTRLSSTLPGWVYRSIRLHIFLLDLILLIYGHSNAVCLLCLCLDYSFWSRHVAQCLTLALVRHILGLKVIGQSSGSYEDSILFWMKVEMKIVKTFRFR